MGETGGEAADQGDPLFQSAPAAYSVKQRDDIQKYIGDHPELRKLIADIMTGIAENRPDEPIKFIVKWLRGELQ